MSVHAAVTTWLDAQVAYTRSHFVFGEYRIPHATTPTDTLDGKHMAGVPDQFVRAGLRSRCDGFAFDADWTWSDALFADDLNNLKIPDWGRGRVDARLSWNGKIAGHSAAPFVAVNNAFGQKYVGSVTLNGTFGRVRESAPGRNWYAGLELGWSVLK
jgi:iron complex outermembrane receptor protein